MKKRYHTKQSLAKAYFPELSVASGEHKLSRWVNQNAELLKKLQKTGYTPRQHHYTLEQQKIIFSVFGAP